MLEAITNVWTAVLTWLTSNFETVSEMFYDSTKNSLTFVGTLAIIMAGVALILLVFNLIRSFFPMRG